MMCGALTLRVDPGAFIKGSFYEPTLLAPEPDFAALAAMEEVRCWQGESEQVRLARNGCPALGMGLDDLVNSIPSMLALWSFVATLASPGCRSMRPPNWPS